MDEKRSFNKNCTHAKKREKKRKKGGLECWMETTTRTTVDEYIAQLYECKSLTEAQVKDLCEKVRQKKKKKKVVPDQLFDLWSIKQTFNPKQNHIRVFSSSVFFFFVVFFFSALSFFMSPFD